MAGAGIKIALCKKDTFEPDINEIAAVVNEKTAAIVINSPNNPSGAVYSRESITELAKLLKKKSAEYGKDIYIISDEPYRELVYGNIEVPFIPSIYDNTVICYSYSKSLSIPGDRIGYVFVSPRASDAYKLMRAVAGAGRSLGYVCAPTLLQKLVAELDGQTSDIEIYKKNRDTLVQNLCEYGFTAAKADGAFYLFLKSPSGDGREFSDTAKQLGLLIVPSEDFGYPGYVRIAYCQTPQMIERSLPKWEELARIYKARGII
jgi:aspartate aminotransferase